MRSLFKQVGRTATVLTYDNKTFVSAMGVAFAAAATGVAVLSIVKYGVSPGPALTTIPVGL